MFNLPIPQISSRTKVISGIIAVLLLVGVGLGYLWFSPAPPVQQIAASEVKRPDGSVIAAKSPDPDAKPSAMLPKDSILTRKISVTARAKLPTIDIGGSVMVETKLEQVVQMVKAMAPPEMLEQAKAEMLEVCKQQECPPVTVNVDLIRQEDGQQRAVVSSNGEILQTVDIPKENAAAPPEPKKNALGLYGTSESKVGVWYTRDMGPVRLLGMVGSAKEGAFNPLRLNNYAVTAGVGIQF